MTSTARPARNAIAGARQRAHLIVSILDAVNHDIGTIVTTADHAVLDPPRATGTTPWAPTDSVGHAVVTRATAPAVLLAADIHRQIDTVREALDAAYAAAQHLEHLRAQAVAASPLTEAQRVELERENADDGECQVCGHLCAGKGSDRLRRVPVTDDDRVPMCDACRKAWERRDYQRITDPTHRPELETLETFTDRRKAERRKASA